VKLQCKITGLISFFLSLKKKAPRLAVNHVHARARKRSTGDMSRLFHPTIPSPCAAKSACVVMTAPPGEFVTATAPTPGMVESRNTGGAGGGGGGGGGAMMMFVVDLPPHHPP